MNPLSQLGWATRWTGLAIAVVVLLAASPFGQSFPGAMPTGLVVESLEPNSTWGRAGVESGDLLLSWEGVDSGTPSSVVASGEFRTPFDVEIFAVEQMSLGGSRIIFVRDGEHKTASLWPRDWSIVTRPDLDGYDLNAYLDAQGSVDAGRFEEGSNGWRGLALIWSRADDHSRAAWLLTKSADALVDAGLSDQADVRYAEAAAEARKTGRVEVEAQVWESKGRKSQEIDQARCVDGFRRALEIRERTAPGTLAHAKSLRLLSAADRTASLEDQLMLEWRANDILSALLDQISIVPETIGWTGRLRSKSRIPRRDLEQERQAVAIARRVVPNSTSLAHALSQLGYAEQRADNLVEAERAYREALAIGERVAPESETFALNPIHRLNDLALKRGDLTEAERLGQKALAFVESRPHDSLNYARMLRDLEILAHAREDHAAEYTFMRRILDAYGRLAPGSYDEAYFLHQLCLFAFRERGDLAGAEMFALRSVVILERLEPDAQVASLLETNLHNLVLFTSMRGDLDQAEGYLRRVRAVRYDSVPDPRSMASYLDRLAGLQMRRGDLAAAAASTQEAVSILEQMPPSRAQLDRLTSAFLQLGSIARRRHDYATAERLYERARAIAEEEGSGHRQATILRNFGDLAMDQERFDEAVRLYREVLQIRQASRTPDPLSQAWLMHQIATALRRKGSLDEATEYSGAAVDVVESKRGRSGGSVQARAESTAYHADLYHDHADLLVQMGRHASAFGVLERAKARSLIETFAERDLLFAADLPASLLRERSFLESEYDRAQAALARLSPTEDGAEIERQLQSRQEIRSKLDEVAGRIREASPRLAAVQYPQPVTWEVTREGLDPGTVLLSYMSTEERTLLFVVVPAGSAGQASPAGPAVFTIPVSAVDLRERVEAYRELIGRKAAGLDELAMLTQAGQDLYDLLIRPAESLIAANDRIVISAAGPLATVPFGALIRGGSAAEPEYLIEWKPISTVPSATVLAELKRDRRSDAGLRSASIVAFGDPLYPVRLTDGAGPDLRRDNAEIGALMRSHYDLRPLPASRREVEAIGQLFPESSTLYLGADAIEERVKALGKGPNIIHIAAHGMINNRLPLDSALVLTIPDPWNEGQDNGLLQAWEIIDGVRIDADLVTLSACESGLGKELPGEGLMGLTRAFLFAGARTVLASIWDVADESTADLMTSFYTGLRNGLTKDEALRAAQLSFIHRAGEAGHANVAHPFYWASFQLTGDWQ